MPRKEKTKIELPKSEESLYQISRFLKLIAGSVAIQQTERIASTEDRKVIWFLCEGDLTRDEIASKSGIKKRTIDYFVDECKNLGLLEEEKEKSGHPNRVIDYVPEDWKQLAREKLRIPQQPATPQTT
jgi:predicted HTH transcriptional regulator